MCRSIISLIIKIFTEENNMKALQIGDKLARLIGYNIMVATKDYADYVKTAAHAGADVIISGAGLPVDLPEYVTDRSRGSRWRHRHHIYCPDWISGSRFPERYKSCQSACYGGGTKKSP